MIAELTKLVSYLSARRRWQFVMLFVLMLIGAAAEMATLGAVLPFLSVIAEPSANTQLLPVRLALDVFGGGDPKNAVVAMLALFVVVLLSASFVRLLLIWSTAVFVQKLGHDLAREVFERIFDQPYAYHVSKNSSELIATISKVQMVVGGVLMPLLHTISGVILSALIIATLVVIAPVMSITAVVAFSVVYLGVSFVCGKWLHSNGALIARAESKRIQILQEGLGGVRDVILDRTQRVFLDRFSEVDATSRGAQASNAIIRQSPRFVIEAIGMVMVASFAAVLSSRSGGIVAVLPSLGALALGAQRILPLVNQVYHGWSSYTSNRHALADVLEVLQLPKRPEALKVGARDPLQFRRAIALEQVSFTYPGSENRVLDQVDLTVGKGTVIGLVGKTGAGKSTISDIIMGLIPATGGRVTVDGVVLDQTNLDRWQACVAHVPQAIYLSDATIAQNIAFGVPDEEIDHSRVVEVARQACVDSFVRELPDGFATFVGERGVRLSGGQRQRIGLARALYKNAQLLVLDEATSALDSETESEVMDAIRNIGEGYTIIIVAHRQSTLELCDAIYRVEEGTLRQRNEPENANNLTQ